MRPPSQKRWGERIVAPASAFCIVVACFGAAPAYAQELSHRFINPSFGGNPFYSEHLRAIAEIDRPNEPEEPTEDPPSEEELLAAQLRAQFLSQLSGDIRTRIQNARPGDTGDFELGDQRISFVRTQTETQITFVNTRTGETRRVVLPVNPSSSQFANRGSGRVSAEQALGGGGSLPGPLGGGQLGAGGLSSRLLDPRSLEIPLRGY